MLRSHTWRTAENSAAYLLEDLAPGQDVLDVGCGPGTITVDLAERVPGGKVIGLDRSDDVLAKAADLAVARGVENVEFEVGDIFELPHADASFDVVHAHQVLQHLGDPVGAMREMRRVLRPGGVLAVRDADYSGMRWYPDNEGLERWRDLYLTMTAHHHPDAGRRLHAWAREAGFTDIRPTASTWCFAEPGDREWWSHTWAERVQHSAYATHAVEGGHADAADLTELARAWERWGNDEDGWFVVIHGEVLARR